MTGSEGRGEGGWGCDAIMMIFPHTRPDHHISTHAHIHLYTHQDGKLIVGSMGREYTRADGSIKHTLSYVCVCMCVCVCVLCVDACMCAQLRNHTMVVGTDVGYCICGEW